MAMDQKDLQRYSEILKLYEVQVDERLPKAKNGDREMSLNLLSVAAGLLKAGLPLPVQLAEWIALGLQGLAAGYTPEESFGFKPRGKGRTAKTAVKIREERFRRAYLSEYIHQTECISLERAFERVAELEHVSIETVNAAWDEAHTQAKMVLAVSLGSAYRVTEVK